MTSWLAQAYPRSRVEVKLLKKLKKDKKAKSKLKKAKKGKRNKQKSLLRFYKYKVARHK